ncbi:hypothetical protein M441DRAFT_58541 [Trichoderma asperellum CBS 433.97]|uniref:Uncharacterized protein n=1 Tax=Trichoderma asperellum (strain ATCC 204424 / CBS 433.97 / NBRC 101777) TaxID=1042311 RepID=A0A2T3Z8G6_TRIA4|nr:hypothetical protein M441DRAFT_58541 [Trichoderma asperellum CBS 433.97]PTB41103.1 hypothetical protein M441DRAFT_58541 [Trichoderma asperellum CBS 433.97]
MAQINFPDLPMWAQTLASILPLSALIEFVDVETSIHVYELRGGSVPFWNWPISPAGARILLSKDTAAGDCFLDQPQRSQGLTCIDGRYGNQYPCSAPATTRLWAGKEEEAGTEIENTSSNMEDRNRREQVLYVVQLRDETTPGTTSGRKHEEGKKNFWQKFTSSVRRRGPRYLAVSCTGWICWIGLVVVSLMGRLYIAVTYLVLMPLTCFVVGLTHGTKPRKALVRDSKSFPRLVIAAGSENPHYWYAFEGHQTLLNGLLNISLAPSQTLPYRPFGLYLLRLLILGQWAMALGSSATMGWDAFVISIWTAFCIVASAYLYPVDVATKDWLSRDCRVQASTVKAVLSSRYALLFALAMINPDTDRDKTKWMDPIIAKSPEREEMWNNMLNWSRGDDLQDEATLKIKWWWRLMNEGVHVGKEIRKKLKGYPEGA